MIDLIAAAGIGGIIGFGTCAFLTMGRVADVQTWADRNQRAFLAANGKLSAIRDLLDTPRTIRKADLRDVLDGDV